MALMDKVGRKSLLLWSFIGMALSMSPQVAGASSYMPKAAAFYLSVGGMLFYQLWLKRNGRNHAATQT